MKIRIIKVKGNQYWYRFRVGEVFEVIEESLAYYDVGSIDIMGVEARLMVEKDDAEVMEEK